MMGDPVFGVDRESLDLVLLHFQADFPFQSGLKNQRQEEQEHHGFDPFYFLEQERGGIMHGFKLAEAFLQGRLVFVGLQCLLGAELGIGAKNRKDAVNVLLSLSGLPIACPRQRVACCYESAISGLASGPAFSDLSCMPYFYF